MKNKSKTWNIVSSAFCVVFFILGVLNMFFVHIVPGVFYILVAFIYFPSSNKLLKKRFGFSIPPIVMIIVGLFILWATLAVGDLMEMFESWLNK